MSLGIVAIILVIILFVLLAIRLEIGAAIGLVTLIGLFFFTCM